MHGGFPNTKLELVLDIASESRGIRTKCTRLEAPLEINAQKDVTLKNPEKVIKAFIVDTCSTKIEENLFQLSMRFLGFWNDVDQNTTDTIPIENITSLNFPDL